MDGLEFDSPAYEPDEEMLALAEKLKPTPSRLCLPKKYLSYSQVEMYLRCAKQYEFRYVKDEKEPPGVAAIFGSGAHKACEMTHHHIVDHGEPASTEQIIDAFSDAFEERAEALPESAWASGADRGSIKDAGVRLVKLYNNKVAPQVRPQVTPEGVRGIEKKFQVLINNVPVVGVIDLIDTNDPAAVSDLEKEVMARAGSSVPEVLRTAVADLKTKSKSMSQGEVDGSLQLTLYSYVEKVPVVRFDQLLNQKTITVKRVHSTRTPHDHAWMSTVFTEVASAITLGVFPPCSPTAWCCSPRWCGFYKLCRGKHT